MLLREAEVVPYEICKKIFTDATYTTINKVSPYPQIYIIDTRIIKHEMRNQTTSSITLTLYGLFFMDDQ